MDVPRNYYDTLQVQPTAQQEVIDAAYRGLARKYHPDVNPSPNAGRIMPEINDAYAVLKDPDKRRAYDLSIGLGRKHEPSSGSTGAPKASSPPSSSPPPPPSVPTHCQKCGRSDASLRFARFHLVLSFVLWTTKRERGGLYCLDCRRSEMARDKLMTGPFGWWGIPFGVIYTIGVLLESNEGEIPVDPSADYLAALGLHFLARNEYGYAREALEASLVLRYDAKLEMVYNDIFGGSAGKFSGSTSQSSKSTSRPHSQNVPSNNGWKWVLYGLFAVCAVIVGAGLLSAGNSGVNSESALQSTESTQVVASATIKKTPTAASVTVNSVWHQEIESQDGFKLDRPINLTRTKETLDDGRISITYAALVGEPFHYINVTSWDEVDLNSSSGEYAELTRFFDDWLTELENATIIRHPQLAYLQRQQSVLHWAFDYGPSENELELYN